MIEIGELIYRMQENPMTKGIKKSDIANHIKSVINLIGAPGLYEDKSIILDIYEYKSQIPADFKSRTTVRRILSNDARVTLTHNTDDAYKTYPTLENSDFEGVDLLYTHKIVGDFIHVDFEEGQVELIYKAFLLDTKGFPIINGGESLRMAIEWYSTYKYLEVLWMMGKLPEKVFRHAETQKMFYMGQATNEALIPDPVEAEAIGNSIVRLIPQTDSLESGHKYDSQKERLNTRHNWRG